MGKVKTILVVEDQTDLRELIAFNLEREGYTCRRCSDGDAALGQIRRDPPDLIILDRMLPNTSGDEVIMRLKRKPDTALIPIIMLTAKAEESDELVGFAMGADDYVIKPFSMKALVARVAALLRRLDGAAGAAADHQLSSGPVRVDTERYEVTVDGVEVALTMTEFRLLSALVAAQGRLRSRDELIDRALGPDVAVTDRTVDVHIASLRKKLGQAAPCLQTVRGAGYRWRPPTSADDQ
ncbi:MAG: response regulator [Phycisphaerae bacterium]